MQAGFPATVITVEQRLAYYEALDKAHGTGDYGDFIALVANSVEQSFKPYWWALGVEKDVDAYLNQLGYAA